MWFQIDGITSQPTKPRNRIQRGRCNEGRENAPEQAKLHYSYSFRRGKTRSRTEQSGSIAPAFLQSSTNIRQMRGLIQAVAHRWLPASMCSRAVLVSMKSDDRIYMPLPFSTFQPQILTFPYDGVLRTHWCNDR